MRSLFLISLLMIAFNSGFAQTKGSYTVDLNAFAFGTGHNSAEWINFSKNADTEGSQFLEEFWSPGTLILKNDTLVQGIDYRYNIYARQMQLRTLKDTLMISHPEKVKVLNFNNRTFIYGPFVKEELSANDYFEVLAQGNCNLLLRREVTFVPKNPPVTPYSVGYENNRFILHQELYLQRTGSPAFFTKATKKSILAYLNDHQEELKSYIKKEKIRFNDNNSLVKLIKYYNSLVE